MVGERVARVSWAMGAAVLVWLLVAMPAVAAFTVTVGSVNYRVALVDVPGDDTPSYNQAAAANTLVPFTQTPWFQNADAAAARSIAEQVQAQTGRTDTAYRVPYDLRDVLVLNFIPATRVDYGVAVSGQSGTTSAFVGGTLDGPDGTASRISWITEVPEIDGPILAQALFVLGAFYLLLRGRLGRRVDFA